MCCTPGPRYVSRYSWIWLRFKPAAGSFSGIVTPEPFVTTVERSALYSVAIWCSSKWRSWVKPSDS